MPELIDSIALPEASASKKELQNWIRVAAFVLISFLAVVFMNRSGVKVEHSMAIYIYY